jgi:hypothetical protein
VIQGELWLSALFQTLVALSDGFGGGELVQTAAIDRAPGDFRVLAVQIRDAGLLDRRPGYYSVKIGLTIAAFAAVGHARCRSIPGPDVHPAGLRRP